MSKTPRKPTVKPKVFSRNVSRKTGKPAHYARGANNKMILTNPVRKRKPK
jgi:hypothetical protein